MIHFCCSCTRPHWHTSYFVSCFAPCSSFRERPLFVHFVLRMSGLVILPPIEHPVCVLVTEQNLIRIAPLRVWPSTRYHAVVQVIACILQQLFGQLGTQESSTSQINIFHTDSIPSISIDKYVERIAFYTDVSEECLILSLISVSRIFYSVEGQKWVNALSIHRLFLTSVLCNGKFQDDSYWNNAYYARVGGVPLNEMARLEVEFLFLMKFELFVSDRTFYKFYYQIIHEPCKQLVLGTLLVADVAPVVPVVAVTIL